MKTSYCLDLIRYNQKPTKKEIININDRITQNEVCTSISDAANAIGNQGHSFTPVTFGKEKRSNEHFVSQQLFALDFDNTISFDEVLKRSKIYRVHIAFAYETFSSINKNKFRVVFQHITQIDNPKLANYIQQALMFIFPECDKACSDFARLYFGGKKSLYFSENNTIELTDLTVSLSEFIYETYNKENHTQRKMDEFLKKTGVVLLNGLPKILCENKKSGVLVDDPINNCIRYSTITPKTSQPYCIYFFENTSKTNSICKETIKRSNYIKAFSWDNLNNCCKLYRGFKSGTYWLYYNELFGLATNLCAISGGTNVFKEILYSDVNKQYESYHQRDFNGTLNYINKKQYHPMHCDKFCPFHKKCEHCDTLISTAKTALNKIEKFGCDNLCDIQTAQDNLEKVFIEAQSAKDNKIHIIKAQTGLGKSTTYLKHLENSDKPYIIAVPTHALKLELLEKALYKGYDVISTPELPNNLPDEVKYKIDRMYAFGAGRNVSKYIRSISENKETDIFDKFMADNEKIKDFDGHIITTHGRFLTFSEQFTKDFNLIIDEDIMRTLMPIKAVKLSRIKGLINSNAIARDKKERLAELIDGLEEGVFLRKSESCISFSDKEIAHILKSNNYGNVIEFLSATVVHQSDADTLQYLTQKTLPNQKIIVLSATADENLYKLYFGKDRIRTYAIENSKYMGNLIQYPSGSFSRNYFSNKPESIPNIEEMLGTTNIITFKNFKKEFRYSTDMNFGNTEGKNKYEGSDLGVVGTPHLHPSVYKMYATALGGNANGEDMKLLEVKHNNYKFWFYTFEDKLLQKLQFWLIESELIQSVGRARLLRYDCTVHLFSNFPLEQATFDYRKFH